MKDLTRSGICAVVGSLMTLLACGSSGSSGTSVVDGDGGASNPAGCPSDVPTTGTSCTLSAGTSCSYDCAHGNGNNSSATCEKGAWSVSALATPCSAPVTCDADAGCIKICQGGDCQCDCSH